MICATPWNGQALRRWKGGTARAKSRRPLPNVCVKLCVVRCRQVQRYTVTKSYQRPCVSTIGRSLTVPVPGRMARSSSAISDVISTCRANVWMKGIPPKPVLFTLASYKQPWATSMSADTMMTTVSGSESDSASSTAATEVIKEAEARSHSSHPMSYTCPWKQLNRLRRALRKLPSQPRGHHEIE
jgi:hypothetical protein